VALVAVGVSGLLAKGGSVALGDRFIAGTAPYVRYSPHKCAELLEYVPDAHSCAAAALSDHAEEVEHYRAFVGVVGAAVLGVWFLARRRDRGAPLPAMLVPTVGATAFGGAAAALGLEGVDALIRFGSDGGAGQWLSGAIVAGAVAVWFGSRLVKELALSAST
jgi:hypothetical protein